MLCSYGAAETLLMPLGAKRFDNSICNWPTTLLALGTEAIGVAVDAPGIPVLFDIWRGGLEWLCTELADAEN